MRRTIDQVLVPATFVALNRAKAVEVLEAMAHLNTSQARVIFAKVAGAWGYNTEGRNYATIPLTDDEKSVIGERVANVVRLPRYVARYRCDKKPTVEVLVRTDEVPAKRRTLRTSGGKARFTLTEVRDQSHSKESITMAAKNTRTKAKSKKAKAAEPEELDDELEGLEELEEIEDIEDEDEELEVEDEDEDDEEEEEEEPKPKRKAKSSKAKSTKSTKRKKAPEPEPDEDEDEDEDEEPAPKKKASKGKASTKSTKAKGKGKAPTPPTRELPAGRLSAADVAEMAGTDARAMRVFLRANEDRFPKDEELGRYSFNKKQATALAKAFKSSRSK